MRTSEPVVLDTDILVFAADTDSPLHNEAEKIVHSTIERGVAILTGQLFLESYNVLTGLRWDSVAVRKYLHVLRQHPGVRIIYPTEATFFRCIDLAVEAGVNARRRIFDYFLAQTMMDNSIEIIYTQNTKDFAGIESIQAVNPFV